MHWISLLLATLLVLNIIIKEVQSSGIFELHLKYFYNEHGRDSEGRCCSGQSDPETGKCIGKCRTRFQICLKHYQATIDTTSPCTYGNSSTHILGENSVNFTDIQKYQNKEFSNPIQFPFSFSWTGTFSLIVEARHETDNTGSNNPRTNNLIQRLSVQQVLEVSPEWKTNKSETPYTWLEYGLRVICDDNYYGPGCANLCRPRDDQFGHYTCSENGEIICLSGWSGKYCEKAKCTNGCKNGSCEKPNECNCHQGWKGALCNECVTYPGCVHGTCKTPHSCQCNEGWGGLFCNLDLNYCTNHRPCRNGGTCKNTGEDLYTCECAPGYTGTDCEKEISSCDEDVSPCQNGGTCTNEPLSKRGYNCQCPKGWSGVICEHKMITCADKPCQHGICRDTSKGFQCECSSGYSGLNCDVHIDNCNPNPCINNGTCVVSASGNYKCHCPSGFTGAMCEENIDDCQGNPCQNGGTCIDMVNQFRCQCVPGFVGSLCNSKVDLCFAKPCANGGTCTSLKNDYKCSCRAGFTGKDCSIDIDECSSSPCRNGGTCVNRVNSFQCLCANGFGGSTCQENDYASATFDARQYEATTQGRSDGLTSGQVILIAVLSVAMPLVAVIAACVVFCMKRKRKRAQEKDDAEARKQNEQNAVATMHHNGGGMVGAFSVKRGSNSGLTFDNSNPNIIKNTWDKSVNNINGGASTDDCLLNSSLYGGAMANYAAAADNNANSEYCGVGQIAPALQRAKSQKQLNTDPTLMHRASQLLSAANGAVGGGGSTIVAANAVATKDYPNNEGKRISVLGESPYCSQRWPSLAAAGVAGGCATQLMATAAAAAAGNANAVQQQQQQQQQQRAVMRGAPHM